jgi:hypothetical protein
VRFVLTVLFVLAVVSPATAQGGLFDATGDAPSISLRPFVDISREKFLATRTFDAVFGESSARFWGGGLQVTGWHGRVYGEVSASRLMKENQELIGQRVFVSDGTVSKLGIPLRSTIEPLEVTGGYRFNAHPRIIPYVGGGFGSYHYTEESDFATPSENLDVTKSGAIFHAGVEARASRWVGVAVDAQYTHVPGIFGNGGVSQLFAEGTAAKAAQERDLGGWAARLKLIVGR